MKEPQLLFRSFIPSTFKVNSVIRLRHDIRRKRIKELAEEGKTQAGIALARGEALYDYTDGYHAAIGQNIEEADVLEVSEGILKELTALRKMVPRLLNQVTQITAEKEELKASQDYTVSLLLETLDEEEAVESSYLEILEMLLAEDTPPEVVVEDFVPNLPRLHDKRRVIEEEELVIEKE